METRIEFLYLSEEDMIAAGVLNMSKCVEVIDETFQIMGKGDYLMGGPRQNDHGLMIYFPKEPRGPRMPVTGPDRRFMSLIAYLGGRFHICGNKWYGSNIENKKKGLPRSILTITLNDPDTSAPLAFMSGNLVSAMRTGAVPGVASKYLASDNSEIAGIIGAGVINRASLMAIHANQKNLKAAKVFDLDQAKAKQYATEMSHELELDVYVVDTIEECVRNSDIINVATSGYKKPSIEKKWLKEGALLVLTGTAELEIDCYKSFRIVADNWKMHEKWLRDGLEHPDGLKSVTDWVPTGNLLELVYRNEIDASTIKDLGQIAIEGKNNKMPNETTILVTGGLPLEDIAWAYEVYQQALQNNIGQKLKLWDHPHWA